jgi:hypothetical protein
MKVELQSIKCPGYTGKDTDKWEVFYTSDNWESAARQLIDLVNNEAIDADKEFFRFVEINDPAATDLSIKYPMALVDYAPAVFANLRFQKDCIEIFRKSDGELIHSEMELGTHDNTDLWFGWEDDHGSWDANLFFSEDVEGWVIDLYQYANETDLRNDEQSVRLDLNILP